MSNVVPAAEGVARDMAKRLMDMSPAEFHGGGLQAMAAEVRKQQTSDQLQLSSVYQAAFSTPAGQQVLEDLIRRTLVATTWNPDPPHGDAKTYGLMREGQNSIVAFILNQVKHAEEKS